MIIYHKYTKDLSKLLAGSFYDQTTVCKGVYDRLYGYKIRLLTLTTELLKWRTVKSVYWGAD